MRLGHRIGMTVGLVLIATAAHAAPGDYRLLSGTLVWPQVLMTERLAVVKGDDGVMYFAELRSPEGLPHVKAGDRVAVVGREGIEPGQVTSATVTPASAGLATGSEANYPSASPSTAGVPSRPPTPAVVALDRSTQAIFGRVELVNGDTLTVAADGRWISVDVSSIDRDIKAALVKGQPVRVLAEERNGRLFAQGVIVEHAMTTSSMD